MKVSAPALFERLKLQVQFRRLINELGDDAAWSIIQSAIEHELRRSSLQISSASTAVDSLAADSTQDLA